MASTEQPLAVLLMGPTASGKTELAIRLREALDGELISVDSALVYRGMDIGTAKPDAGTLARAPHRLIDICDPATPYSAADFREDACQAMDEAVAAGRTPILVGGTMLYFRALCFGMAAMPAASPETREALARRFDEEGGEALYEELARVDSVAAAGMHPNNRQRLLRALEVYQVAGRPISELWAEEKAGGEGDPLPYRTIPIALSPPERADLHQRIERRFHTMLEQGLIEEVRAFYERGDLSLDLPSMRAVGYRQVWEHLAGKTGYNEMVERALAATRQLAKRQITWLRGWPDCHWLDGGDPECLGKALKIIRAGPTLESDLPAAADGIKGRPVR
jgi:tRNA dimethylallyltransferase